LLRCVLTCDSAEDYDVSDSISAKDSTLFKENDLFAVFSNCDGSCHACAAANNDYIGCCFIILGDNIACVTSVSNDTACCQSCIYSLKESS
jgi:hypothetical protein